MKVIRNMSRLAARRRPVVLACGFFDGIHLGHTDVIRKTMARARRLHGEAWILTFDPHPQKILQPYNAPLLLTSTRHKLQLLSELGVYGAVIVRFTPRFARLSPDGFAAMLCKCAPALKEILVGDDWRFGSKGKGDVLFLKKFCAPKGIRVRAVKPTLRNRHSVSSTRIREAVITGRLDEASRLLGRTFSVLSTVVSGRHVGRTLGFPTANMDPHGEALPPFGVYAVRARIGNNMFDGVLNIGIRPTFSDRFKGRPSFELHMPGIRRNLYGKYIEVFFARKIRPEKKFASASDLRQQIAADISAAKRILKLFEKRAPALAKKIYKNPFTV